MAKEAEAPGLVAAKDYATRAATSLSQNKLDKGKATFSVYVGQKQHVSKPEGPFIFDDNAEPKIEAVSFDETTRYFVIAGDRNLADVKLLWTVSHENGATSRRDHV